MSKNITLMGASYADVPAVVLPQTGGGTAEFTDTSDADATAGDIAQGKTAYVNGVKIVGTGGGGGTTWTTLKDGNVTIVSSSPNYIIINDYTTAIEAGQIYRITWGNVTHEFTSIVDSSGTSYDGYLIGNPVVVGGTDDGSGIALLLYRDRANRLVGATTDSAGTKYLKIELQTSSGGGNYQAKTNISPTTSSQTIYPDTGYDALESVQINAMPTGTAGTPTATKGTVSNHSISVTPSVTNTTGHITGGTITGTAVTVAASELVSGSETKTANGTYDVTNLASLIVNVTGGTSNVVTGTFTGTNTGAAMDVNLSYTGSGYPIAFIIYPEGGSSGNTTFNSLLQRYATCMFCGSKQNVNTAAEYSKSSTSADGYQVVNRYKSSTSTSTTMSQAGSTGYITSGVDATSTNTNILNFKNKTKMSVFIANTSYGFAANIQYRYWVIYSS